MNRGDVFLFLFMAILATSFLYIYQNMDSLDCYMDQGIGDVMSDIEYDYNTEGSLYGKTRIYRFIISSSRSRLEYFGMNITAQDGTELFFKNITNPEGGSIITTISLKSENETVFVERFFKKKCFEEMRL
ncbi:MAG: hypothetical protein JW700_03830 [Candidatus Aenigmarchaeota archaeon]|nr:hypothetical protein [Candidatus Aenigmarchaeota archaeon]